MAKRPEDQQPDAPAAAAPAAAAAVATGPVIYLGPRLMKPVHLAPNAVFRGELPAELSALAAQDNDLRACLVPVDQAGRALRGAGAEALATARVNVANRYLGRK